MQLAAQKCAPGKYAGGLRHSNISASYSSVGGEVAANAPQQAWYHHSDSTTWDKETAQLRGRCTRPFPASQHHLDWEASMDWVARRLLVRTMMRSR